MYAFIVQIKIALVGFFTIFSYPLFGQYIYIDDGGTSNLVLSEKKDLIILGIKSNIEKNVQLGYSPLQCLSIKTGYLYHSRAIEKNGRNAFTTSGNIFSGSIGTYYFFKKENNIFFNKRKKWAHESGILPYINLGYSRAINRNEYYSSTSKFNYQKYFIDTGLKLRTSFGSLDFNFKYSKIHFISGEITGNFYEYEGFINNAVKSLEAINVYSTLEFNIQVQLGIRQISIIAGMPMNVPINRKNQPILNSKGRTPYIGIVLELDEIFKIISEK